MKFAPDDEDRLWRESQQEGWFRFSSPLRYIIFLIFIICLLIGLWYLLSPTNQTYNQVDLALIRADEKPYKVKAEDQGVPSVKHQDKLVYGRIRGEHTEPAVEHILPDPEPPLSQIKEDSPSLKMVEQYTPEDIELDKTSETATDSSPKTSEEKPLTLTSIEDLIEGNSPKESIEEVPVVEKKAAKRTVIIQLGSLKSYDLAESEWARIQKKHKDILGNLEPTIQKVDLGAEQGIYYRLRTGHFESLEKANSVCAALKERKVDCIVIR